MKITVALIIAGATILIGFSVLANPKDSQVIYPLGVDDVLSYQEKPVIFSEYGVIISTQGRKCNKPVYHPTIIARYAFDLHAEYVKTREVDLIKRALQQTDYIAKILIENCEKPALLKYPYSGSYGLKPGWGSAMGQGLAIGALSLLKSDSDQPDTYSAGIQCGLRAFEVDVFEGGLLTALSPSEWWYEEYPAPQRPQVLNGHIFALSGLWLATLDGNTDPRTRIHHFEIADSYFACMEQGSVI